MAAGSAALSAACGSKASPGSRAAATAATAPAPPSGASSTGLSRVVLIRSDDRAAGTRAAIDLLQPTGLKGRSVFLKPNDNTADPAPAATDTPLLDGVEVFVDGGPESGRRVHPGVILAGADAAGCSLADDLRRIIAA